MLVQVDHTTRRRGGRAASLIAELRQLTSAANRLRQEGADAATLEAKRTEIEWKQFQLAEAVKRGLPSRPAR